MARPTIYHNPRCTKSRQTLTLLKEQGLDPRVVEYLSDPPSESTLRGLLKKLGLTAKDVIRKKEFRELGLTMSDDESELVALIAANPKILERPIVVSGSKAAIGRPPENVLEIL